MKKILVVDDDADILSNLEELIDSLGYPCITTQSSTEALKILSEQQPIDAVLSDIHMVDMNGIELLAKIRAKGLNIPFAFLSGFGSLDITIDAARLGSFEFIEKPYKIEELKSVIDRILEVGHRNNVIQTMLHDIVSRHSEEKENIDSIERNLCQIERLRSISTMKKYIRD